MLGLASDGLHSNGFSLVRKIVDDAGFGWDASPESLAGGSLADHCLRPTRIYTNVVRAVQSHYRVKQVIHGIAHISGGGIEENLDRILPSGLDAHVDSQSWEVPAIFSWLQKTGQVDVGEMRRVFNMGIGLAIVVSEFYAPSIAAQINDCGVKCFPIGKIAAGTGVVKYVG